MKSGPVRFLVALVIGVVILLNARCGFVHDQKIAGPYRLVAIDVLEEMSVCYTLEGGGCVGRIPDTVFSIGWNERFIVAKQHPPGNKKVTNYFILEIEKDSKFADPSVSVLGPLSDAVFKEKAISLKLPPFTRTIEALK